MRESFIRNNKPHISRAGSPLFMQVYTVTGRLVHFDDWVCMNRAGFFGRGKTIFAAYHEYKVMPRHHAHSY